MLYTCGGYNQQNYGVGILRYRGGDPTDAAAWEKLPGPLFTGRPEAGVWCAGAACAFASPDGTETWFAYSDYHAYDETQKRAHGPRTIMAQRVMWRADGTPDLGRPVATTQALPLPSGDPGPVNTAAVSK